MLSPTDIAGCVLAGGQSRRMGGRDKALAEIAGAPMIAHVIERLRRQVGPVLINSNADAAAYATYSVPVVADRLAGHLGPLAGVHAGLSWLAETHPNIPYMATVSTDAPVFPEDLVPALAAAIAPERNEIAMAASHGRLHPVIALWPVALLSDLESHLRDGVRKVLQWTDRHTVREVAFDDLTVAGRTIDPFFNANTPDDLKALEDIVRMMKP